MFIEKYRYESGFLMSLGDLRPVPYPKLSDKDWSAWKLFLPFHAATTDRVTVMKESLYFSDEIPYPLIQEIKKATEYFDKVEIWRQHEGEQDPIAVGVLGSDRYLIARWARQKLVPFNALKKAVPLRVIWKYAASPVGAVAGLAMLSNLVWGVLKNYSRGS